MSRPLIIGAIDLYVNTCNWVLFYAPAPGGRLDHLVKWVGSGRQYLAGWVFTDQDMDEECRVCGTIEEGRKFEGHCLDLGLRVGELRNLSVPFANRLRSGEHAGEFPYIDFFQARPDLPVNLELSEIPGTK